MKMYNIAVVPARSGSKRIPEKNIKEINGKPLIYWTLKAAEEAECIHKVFVSTDSIEYIRIIDALKVLYKFDKSYPIPRESKHATAKSQIEDFMIPLIAKNKCDNVILLQPTSPVRLPGTIDRAFKLFIEENADALVSVTRLNKFIWQDNKPNYNILKRPRSQEYKPNIFLENGSIYITKRDILLNTFSRVGGEKIVTFELTPEESFEIDEELDFLICETILSKYIRR